MKNNDIKVEHDNLRSYNIKRSESEEELPCQLQGDGSDEKMKILQNFLQNPCDTKNQINFSPQRILQEKYPEVKKFTNK